MQIFMNNPTHTVNKMMVNSFKFDAIQMPAQFMEFRTKYKISMRYLVCPTASNLLVVISVCSSQKWAKGWTVPVRPICVSAWVCLASRDCQIRQKTNQRWDSPFRASVSNVLSPFFFHISKTLLIQTTIYSRANNLNL